MTEKKVAIVTGGTRGIGKAIAEKLIASGYNVAAIYHGDVKAAKAFEEETGGKSYKLDVCDFEACKKTVEKISKDMGPVSVLVNNAGITRDGMLHKTTLERWQSVIDTNLNSCFNMCHAVIPSMRENRHGRIVNISSINGQKGQLGQTNYSAAKAGMLGFTKALALESAARGITVNAICPGYINTDMTADMPHEILESIVKTIPTGRLGKPEEIASMVGYLVSDEAAFINGATMTVNGCQYMAA
ncbi:MAG: beta-ketoacyl-ACP reductase [Micavibrio sp.]|nr:beta-ketoacyl-ACP reductase [Micavibrio sp.]